MISIVTAISLVVVGFALVWISKRLDLGFGDISKAALVLTPLLVYLIVTGKIAEFEALGWKAKFQALASESVISAAKAADLVVSEDEANSPNFFKEAFLLPCRRYYVLRDKEIYNDVNKIDMNKVIQIAIAIRTAIVCGQFKALVVVDENFKPVGFFNNTNFIELIRIPLVLYGTSSGEKLGELVMQTELGVVLKNPIVRANSADASQSIFSSIQSIESVYKIMIEGNTDIAVITDRLGRFDGIVTRSAIEGWVISQLLAERPGRR